ncbi:MAG: hypothetical protein GYB67_14895, partial [Chloroflexi bacterium]|nr:hypothetical protein [Chloroflexota bacterium]
MTRVLIEIHEGQVVRNLLENDLLSLLTAHDAEVMVVTPGARVPKFVERYTQPGVEFCDLLIIGSASLTRWENYESTLGKWLSKRGQRAARQVLWGSFGERLSLRGADAEHDLLDSWRPDVVVSTHLSQTYGRRLIAAAR